MAHSLSPRALTRVLQLVNTGRWGTTSSVFAAMWEVVVEEGHHPDTFVGVSLRELADHVRLGESAVRRSLKRLVAEGVLEADGLASGSRPEGYRFADLTGWVGVPWRGDLTALEAALVIERWLRPVEVAAPTFARPSRSTPRPVARARGRALPRRSTRAQTASGRPLARAPERALDPTDDAADTLLEKISKTPPTPRARYGGATPTPREGVLFAAITRLTGQYLASDGWKDRVARVAALEELDLERLVADVEPAARKNRSGPSQVVVLLEQAAAVQLAGGGAVGVAHLEREAIERDLAVHRRMRAQYLEAGDDELVAMRDKAIEECETRLAQIAEGAA